MSDETTKRRWFRSKAEDRTLTPGSWPQTAILTGSTFASPGPQEALAVADVFACVRTLSDAAASIPLIPYRATTAGRTRAGGSLADLLQRPAPGFTQANLIGGLVAHLNVWGNAYLGKFRGESGRIEQIAPLRPERVIPSIKDGQLVFTYSDGLGKTTDLSSSDVIHIRAMSTDGLMGLSPIRQAAVALGSAQGLGEFTNAFFQNGARPAGILKIERSANTSQLNELRETFSQRHRGTTNAHKIAVLSGEVEWTPLVGPADDLQFVEQRKLSTAEVARIFRVPPWMIGASVGDSLTYSSTEQQNLMFVTHSLRPWLVAIEQAITNDPDLAPGGLYVEFLLDALLRADSKTRADIYSQALDPVRGWMTRDEVRRLENLDPETTTNA